MRQILAALIAMICIWSGYSGDGVEWIGGSGSEVALQANGESDFPGDYQVPDGWVKSETNSTEQKIFYVQEGHEADERPDNISISVGENRYAAEDHLQFRDAIFRQLAFQTQGLDAELTGEGSFTEQGYPIYIFTIEEKADGVITRQYYVVGEQRYCLIHLTSFAGDKGTYQAAQAMADSFVWKDEL